MDVGMLGFFPGPRYHNVTGGWLLLLLSTSMMILRMLPVSMADDMMHQWITNCI
jgi:hypothetical protein